MPADSLRSLLNEHGLEMLMGFKKFGHRVAPKLTRRMTPKVRALYQHRALGKRLVDKVVKVHEGLNDTIAALGHADIAGGVHSAIHTHKASEELWKDATDLIARTRTSAARNRFQTNPRRPAVKKTGQTTATEFDDPSANQPEITPDLLHRLQKSVRSSA